MDFYIPAFEIYIGGKKEGKLIKGELKKDIISVSYTDSLDAIDSFSLTISNWDEDRWALKHTDFDSELLTVGKELEVWMGYAGRTQAMIDGEITAIEPNFPQSGYPTLDIRGLNILHRLRGKQETHVYINKTDRQIASQIAGRLRLKKGNIKGDQKYDFLVQDNRYDIVFLMERARRIGYEFFVDEESKLYFQPSTTNSKESYILEWGKSLINFRPTLTTTSQVGEVIVKGWDPRSKKTITGKAKRNDIQTNGLSAAKMMKIRGAFENRSEIIVNKPIRSQREADEMAKNKLEQSAKEMVKGDGTTLGLPDLRAGTTIMLDKLGETFSGIYFVTGTTHSINESGYTTKFSARKEEK
jgi:phage protein D